jgi:glycosyltransferase involved in cell wall biosynthesis
METDLDSIQPPYPRIASIDVVVCTWNRASQLSDTLESLTKLIVPYDRQLRVIIVDNNSTDDTADVIKKFGAHKFFNRHDLLPLFEPQQGHTFSRNAAIEHLDGDLVMWTDDDVAVDSFWVQKMVEFADLHAETAFFGGPIEAKLLPHCPDWVEENWETLKGCFADRQIGDQPLPLADDRLPYGANFAVRGCVQKAFTFNTELGRRADDVLGEDELDVMRRMLDEGLTGQWNPEARVTHVIPAQRVNEEYVRQYFVGQGRALVRKADPWDYSPRKLWWTSIGNYLMFRFKRKFADSPEWLAHLIRSGLAEGQYVQRED